MDGLQEAGYRMHLANTAAIQQLHSNNNYLVVMDSGDQVVFRRRLANVLEEVV